MTNRSLARLAAHAVQTCRRWARCCSAPAPASCSITRHLRLPWTMTPAEAAVLAAARAYRDAHMRCLRGESDSPDGIDMDAAAGSLLTAATFLMDAAEQPGPTIATARPWPDPEA